MTTRTLAIGLGAVMFLAGCPPIEQACDTMAVASVNVTVVDEAGADVPDATVVFSVDGGADQPCDDFGDTWACGFEIAGEITVKASAPGLMGDAKTVTIVMEDDGCHVAAQAVTLTLLDECDDPPPAMMVTVLDPDGSAAEGEAVSWGRQGSDAAPQACAEDGSAGVWACGYGASGDLELYVTPAETDPYQGHFEELTVAEGECGPETVFKTVTLQYLPD